MPKGAKTRDDPLTRLATAPPRTCVHSPSFWLRQTLYTSAVVLGAAALLLVYPLALGGVSARIERYVSVANLVLWLWAVFDGAVTLATIEVNLALATFVCRKGEEHLRDLRAGSAQRIRLDELTTRFLPNNPVRPAVTRMVEHILAEARDRQFNFSGNLVRMYREEGTQAVGKVERLQQMTLRLGILGTFIGLGAAMHAVPAGLDKLLPIAVSPDGQGATEAVDASRDAFMQLAHSLVGALGDAFGTSIAGLTCSVSIWAMAHVLRKKQFQQFDLVERAAEVMTSLARNAENPDQFHEQFRKLIEHLDQLKIQLYDRVGRLGEDVVRLDGKVSAQMTALDSGLQKLKNAGGSLDAFLKQLTTNQSQVLQKLSELFERAELRQAFVRLEDAIDKAGKTLGTRLETRAEKMLGEATPLAPELTGLSTQIAASVRALERLEARVGEIGVRMSSAPPPRAPLEPPQPRGGGNARTVATLTIACLASSAATLLMERVFQ
jgi:hypothetical protein